MRTDIIKLKKKGIDIIQFENIQISDLFFFITWYAALVNILKATEEKAIIRLEEKKGYEKII